MVTVIESLNAMNWRLAVESLRLGFATEALRGHGCRLEFGRYTNILALGIGSGYF